MISIWIFSFLLSWTLVFADESSNSNGNKGRVVFFPAHGVSMVGESTLFSGEEVFVRTMEKETLQIPQGELIVQRGFAYLKRESDYFVIQGLSGQTEFVLKKTGSKLPLVPLTEIRIYKDGSVSLIKAIDLKEHLKAFQRVFQPSRESLTQYSSLVGNRLKQTREGISQYYSEFYQRQIAQAQQTEQRKVETKKTQISQRQILRRLYEKKVFGFDLDEDPSSRE